MSCPKCHAITGNSWSQCHGLCPMLQSPHFNAETRASYTSALPLTVLNEKVALFQKDFKAVVGEEIHRDKITCVNCCHNANCEFSFDGYNTDGDCLALK
jgi:hypothetical protein